MSTIGNRSSTATCRASRKDEDITAEIGAVVVGDRPGRESDDEIIYVNTVGLGVQDVALGSLLLANAREKGLGTTVKMWDEPFVL